MSEKSEPHLTREEVAFVAHLALLELTDDEIEQFTWQLEEVLDTADAMTALDLHDVEPTHHPLGFTNVMRPDVVVPSLDRAEVLSQAPAVEDDRFKVPPALGEA